MRNILIEAFSRLIVVLMLIGAFYVYRSIAHPSAVVMPKFHKGDCVRENLSDEFHTRYDYLRIMEVGKTHYDTLNYSNANGQWAALRGTIGVSFGYVDSSYEKTECPSRIYLY